MSDGRVRAAVEQMEAWVNDPAWEPDAEALLCWKAGFLEALAQTEKAKGWSDLIARAHAAGRLLDRRADVVAEERDRLRARLATQDCGNRALRSYGASVR